MVLPPKFCLFPDVRADDFKLEQSIGNVRARWDRQGNRDFDSKGNEVTENNPDEKVNMEDMIKEHEGREPFNPEKKTLNFGGIRPTYVRSCPRVQLPEPRSTKEECELATRDTS